MSRKPSPPSGQSTSTSPPPKLTEEKMTEIISQAKQTVKPIINQEAANEVITDEVLNFLMKSRR
jgi:hypothetical protein